MTFRRLLVTALLASAGILLLLTTDYWLTNFIGAISFIFSIVAFVIAVTIFLENRHPAHTISWLFLLAFNPMIGFVFYILFGQKFRKQRKFHKKAILDDQAFAQLNFKNDKQGFQQLLSRGNHWQKLFQLAQNIGKTPVSFHTDTKVLTNGDETFAEIKRCLKQARHHIHMEYYIVRNDELGREIKDILIEKAKSGVEVRFLYDGVGSWTLPRSYIREMRQAGVRIYPFFPVRIPWFNNRINYRNHRKIIVIDGDVGFIGGLNIGDEYLGKNLYFGFWRDTHLWVYGEAVRSLQLIFLRDWFYNTDEHFDAEKYLTETKAKGEMLGGVQMVAGGPDQDWEVIKHLFFAMIVSAKKSIWIASPYFVPDEDILSALKVAALSGVDVRMLVPARPDKRMVFYASRSYFTELLEAGARIFAYQDGFMHSKILIIDHELASIGSSNMDLRSFHLNFEVNAFLYHSASVKKLVQDYLEDLKHSKEIELQAFQKRPIYQRVFESFSRLASPLL